MYENAVVCMKAYKISNASNKDMKACLKQVKL